MKVLYPEGVDEQKVVEWLRNNVKYSTLSRYRYGMSAYDDKGCVYAVYDWYIGCTNRIYLRRKKDKKLFMKWFYNISVEMT